MDAPFDRYTIPKEATAQSDRVNTQFGQSDRSLRFLIEHLLGGRASDASPAAQFRAQFVGNGFRVAAVNPAAMQVTVAAGLGFNYDLTDAPTDIGAPDYNGVSDLAPVKPLPLVAPVTFNVPAAPAGPNTRIDIIEVRTDRQQTDTDLVSVFDEATESFVPNSRTNTMAFALDGETGQVNAPANSVAGLSYKVGVAANPGVAPATTAGYVKIAEIDVGSGVVTITDSNIRDTRVIAALLGVVRASIQFRLQWTGGAPVVTVDSVVAPPGVRIGAWPDTGGRSKANVYVVGGVPTKATFQASAHEGAVGGTGAMAGGLIDFGPYVGTVSAGDQTKMAAASPAIAVAQGQVRAVASLESKFVNNGGVVNQTDVSLEDIRYTVEVDLAYH